MASSPSALLKIEQQATGENDGTWGIKLNTVATLLEQAIAGEAAITVTSGDVTLTDTQYVSNQARKAVLNLSGALTGDRQVIVPSRTKPYWVFNGCTGAHKVTIITAAGTGVDFEEATQGKWGLVYCDGVNVVDVGRTLNGAMSDVLDTNGNAINFSEGTAVAAASSTNIWSVDGNTLHVTGNTGIADFGTAPRIGAWRSVIFDGTPLLTHSANLNLNRGGADIQIAAGDLAICYADTTTQIDVFVIPASGKANKILETFIISLSDTTTDLAAGAVDSVTFRLPFAFRPTEVRASLQTASSSGAVAFDINEGGVSILSTTLTIDENEKTSTTAATAAVISDTTLADDAELTFDVDSAGTGARGAKVTMIGYRI